MRSGKHLLQSLALAAVLAQAAHGHATPTVVPVGRMHAEGNLLFDESGQTLLLRGVQIPGLQKETPDATTLRAISSMSAHTFVLLRQRWNANAVRLPVAGSIWRRDGQAYLDKVAAIVKLANDAGLVAVLAEFGGTLPSTDTA